MNESLLFRLINLQASKCILRLNETLPKFILISELLSHNEIKFETWNPNKEASPGIVEMSFTADCNFQDVFLLAYFLKDYGLERIYPSRKGNSEISIGTYLFQVKDLGFYALTEHINIDTFLTIDPKLKTRDVINKHFGNSLDSVQEEEIEQEYQDDYEYSDNYNDWERYYFDAMSDGQLGNYDDFEGNIDNVETWSRG